MHIHSQTQMEQEKVLKASICDPYKSLEFGHTLD